ncbi:prephenate dehydrogenase dimerization domain-containing protein [Sorangium sp. So ce726]|uniref:prephenate dehydrogenase dimerization domain-containing protein n=1 Tax=Sorangium sp. So ce726 TaxID=3133319 RepID=UPI003F6282E4
MKNDANAASTRCVVVGAKGSIGAFLATRLSGEGLDVTGIDISDAAYVNPTIAFHADDITRPSDRTCAALSQARTVVLALSQSVLERALPQVLPHLHPDCLIVETLSIKTPFHDLLDQHRPAQPVLGINPMFSGDLDPRGRPVAAVVHRSGAAIAGFLSLLDRWQLRVVVIEPHEHDRTMATLQSLCHAAILSFGRALCQAGVSASSIAALAPPPFRVLLSLVARMTQNHPDVYWEIQSANPYAGEARQRLQASLQALDAEVSAGERERFHDELHQIKAVLIEQDPRFLQTCRRIFQIVDT